MAFDKPRNTSLPHANRPKVPTSSSMKRSASDESSMRRNLKRTTVESSQLGDDIEEQDAIFRPWRGLSNLQDNINEEYEIDGWEKLRKWAAASVVVYGAYAASLVASLTCLKSHVDRPLSKNGEGDIHRQFHLSRLTQKGEQDCRNELHMGKDAFARLVCILRDSGRLRDSTVEEQVAKFLNIIGHNRRNYSVKLDYWGSKETVSRHFHNVLKAIISLESIFLKQPDCSECPPEIANCSRSFPYFKDCVGAIDGSHFRVKEPSNVVHFQVPYYNLDTPT